MAKVRKETPLMKQYNQIKAKYPDALLLFRVGDFYETFGEDAIKAADILGIILTKRGAGSTSETELAGFPHHSLNTYLPKLVRAGCRVAICDQLEDPKMTKKIVKRGVTELVTPGVALNDDVLEQKKNNYLGAIYQNKQKFGLAFLDISTGDFHATEGTISQIKLLLEHFSPKELLVPKPQKKTFLEQFETAPHCFYMDDWAFEESTAKAKLLDHFDVHSLEGFGMGQFNVGVAAAGAVLHYLSETHHEKLQHITRLLPIQQTNYVGLDPFTVRNLELFQPTHAGGVALIGVIDYTKTAMGGRLLRHWLAFPLLNLDAIEKRHEVIATFLASEELHAALQQMLQQTIDIERIMAKIATEKIAPRALVQLQHSLTFLKPLGPLLEKADSNALKALSKKWRDPQNWIDQLQEQLDPDAPVLVSKGKVIAAGYSQELDTLRGLKSSVQEHLDSLLERETKRTQIPSLKIAFNNVFGYYIEVRNTHKDKVPEDWIRKQTLVNAERYITEELKTFETKILSADEQILQLEQQLFANLIKTLQKELSFLKENAQVVAQLDVLSGFAQLAQKRHYCKPELNEGSTLTIKGGRHPVIEFHLPPGSTYIANDLDLNREEQQIVMITGPNMSGKSALLRQTALIALLAQIGSYVPATAASLCIVDKIFTRVGASDNISMGASTFMVEMNETASILNNITAKSLVLLDEIGRGTSTYDGISIAWAIAEYLHEHPYKPKVLFATHYHELNAMAADFERIKNYNVSVKEMKNKVLFLRKLVPGGSAHSFGIHVAKMAGMPQHVVQTASCKLKVLEAQRATKKRASTKPDKEAMQLQFFKLDDPLLEALREEITQLDIDTLTPVEALLQLNAIKRKLQQKG